ncbi:MAG: protein kinase domain-containing protein [Longimicrobiaceae bacterium]
MLFDAALELPAAERAAFLTDTCGEDAELRAEVERYLRTDAAPPALFDAAPSELVAVPADEPALEGRTLGRYTLLRELGRGGMGTVYLAERADVGKRVALKRVRGGLAAPENVERFLREQRVLARLEHPNITSLVDVGVTAEGAPFLAMELAEGEPIDRYCDARRLSLDARLALFAQVCAAVQHAHQSLVIHRDLKPSNILVDGDGRAKLLDFGIAKLLDDAEGEAPGLTGTGMRLMTPEYAAPEQLRGEPVTTATDVYGLGVVLYELLTGHRPYAASSRSWGDIERQVLDAVPARPSSAVFRPEEIGRPDGALLRITPEEVSAARGTTPAGLRRALRGDLDTLVLKAIEKEPGRRYASAQQLLDDLERYRRGLPIGARPATLGYRARKFVRRHRAGVAASATFLLLLGGVGISLQQERDAAARALLEAENAQQAAEFLGKLFGTSDPRQARGRLISTPALLEWGERQVGVLDRQPQVQAQVLSRIGEAYIGLGFYPRAAPLLERALEQRRALHPGDHPDVAASLWWLSTMRIVEADFGEAESLFRESLAMRRRLFGNEDPQVVEGLSGLGFAMLNRGGIRPAEQVYREALAIERQLPGGQPRMIPGPLNGVAFSLIEQGRYAEAESHAREALARAGAEQGEDHPFYMIALAHLARALHGKGEMAEAEALFRQAVEKTHSVQGAEHPRLALYLGWYASLLVEMGDPAGAEALARRALDIQRTALPPGHYWTVPTLTTLGRILTDTGRAREAEPLLREAVAIAERWLPSYNHDLARARSELGACLAASGRTGEAEPLLAAGYTALRDALGEEHPATRQARERLRAAKVANPA